MGKILRSRYSDKYVDIGRETDESTNGDTATATATAASGAFLVSRRHSHFQSALRSRHDAGCRSPCAFLCSRSRWRIGYWCYSNKKRLCRTLVARCRATLWLRYFQPLTISISLPKLKGRGEVRVVGNEREMRNHRLRLRLQYNAITMDLVFFNPCIQIASSRPEYDPFESKTLPKCKHQQKQSGHPSHNPFFRTNPTQTQTHSSSNAPSPNSNNAS
jgi:hypothetical protein